MIEAGTSARQAAARFGDGVATAIEWDASGAKASGAPRKQGQPKRSKRDPHHGCLLGLIEAEPDIRIAETRARLAAEMERGRRPQTLWSA